MTDLRICHALPKLFDDVVARFELDGTNVDQHFGWREPQKHKTARARIVWVPGDEGGTAGEIRAARNPGRSAEGRPIATLGELFHVRIAVVDPQFREDERAQYSATRTVFDAWVRAVYLAAHGTILFGSPAWNTDKNERRHGAELVCVCEVEAKIPDAPYDIVPADAVAEITTSLDDVDEVTTTATP